MSAKVGRMPTVVKNERRNMLLRLDSKLADRLDEIADSCGVSVNFLINEAVNFWLTKDK